MSPKAEVRAEAERLLAAFTDAGAEVFETDILQPAEALLDLYGEDIRARAYVASDPLRGEVMLRPDFTVPLVQHHLDAGLWAGRYAYVGEVFRRQEMPESGRPNEYLQAGFELFGDNDPAVADAEVYARVSDALQPLGLRGAMGDIGLLRATVEGLGVSPERKAALSRHIWRPRRFKALIDAFSAPQTRAIPGAQDLADAGPIIGLRTEAEIEAGLQTLVREASEPLLPQGHVALLEDLLAIRAATPDALSRLRDLTVDLPAMQPAVDRLEARLAAMSARGVDLDAVVFEASYGRTAMEYYDGFVFGLHAPEQPDWPPLATGGRYDALLGALGGPEGLGAVGGVIRPNLVVDLGGGS